MRSTFLLVIVVALGLLWAAGGLADFAQPAFPRMFGVLVVIGLAALVAGVVGALRRHSLPPLQWSNDDIAHRITNLTNMLALTGHSVVIVTGCLHHGLYDNDKVLDAFTTLPKTVRIKVYYERALDARSGRLIDELRRRHATFARIHPGAIAHGAVFDARHCKVEAFGVADDSLVKAVDYYVDDEIRAQRMLREISAVPLSSDAVSSGGRTV